MAVVVPQAGRIFDYSLYKLEELQTIADLVGFDSQFYLTEYPEIARSGKDPLKHYLRHGVNERRQPARFDAPRISGRAGTWLEEILGFDRRFYAATYPDVKENHAQHFVEHGAREHRLPFNLKDTLPSEQLLDRVLAQGGIALNRPLEESSQYDPEPWCAINQKLREIVRNPNVSRKPYRNNSWLALGLSFLACGQLGAAAVCYNLFFNVFIPTRWLGNTGAGVVGTAIITKIADAIESEGVLLARPSVAKAAEVSDPAFLNRPVEAPSTSVEPLPQPTYGILADVEAIGGTSLLVKDGHRIFYDYTEVGGRAREMQCPNIVHVVGNRCAYRRPSKLIEVEEAYWMLHDHGHNYHHWLLEILPRYILALENGLPPTTPLLVDKIAPQMRELLEAASGISPTLIEIPRGAAARVKRLHCMTDICVNTVHTEREPRRNDILFSPTMVTMLTALARAHLTDLPGKYKYVQLIRRNVAHRRLINRGHLERSLRDVGLWSFDPGDATWAQQVRVFSNAQLIIAEAGASLANLIFCQPNATVIVLVQGHKHSNYYYLAQLARLSKVRIYFFECYRLEGSHSIGVQEDMIAPLGSLITWIKRFVADPSLDIHSPARPRRRGGT